MAKPDCGLKPGYEKVSTIVSQDRETYVSAAAAFLPAVAAFSILEIPVPDAVGGELAGQPW
jgi:hypothetical protein